MSKAVIICNPTYNDTMTSGTAAAVYRTGTEKRDIHIFSNPMSLVAHNCNFMYAHALNLREKLDLEWAAFLHSDIAPSQWWIDALIAEGEENDAQIVSAFVPIKDDRAVTSTAIKDPNFDWTPFTRITQKQHRHVSWPKTVDIFQAANALEALPEGLRVTDVPRSVLQVNTGCCIVKLDHPLSEKLYFDQLDTIYHDGRRFVAKTQSEDWRFSERAASLGMKVVVTKVVRCKHFGAAEFDSHGIWGQNRDDDCLIGEVDEDAEVSG